MAATGKNNQGKNDSKRNNLKKNATDFKEKISNGEPMRLNKFLSDAGVCQEDKQTAIWNKDVILFTEIPRRWVRKCMRDRISVWMVSVSV